MRSGIVRSGEDRVQVFALVNQTRTNKQVTEPEIYKNWVTITMEKVDGDWLVADTGHLTADHPLRRGVLDLALPREFMIVRNAAPGPGSVVRTVSSGTGFVRRACVR